MSVSRLEKKGFSILFEDGKRNNLKKGEIVAIAYRSINRVYPLNFRKYEGKAYLTNGIKLWHERLGHLSYENMKKLQGQIEGMNFKIDRSSEVCSICVEGKLTKLPHNSHRRRTIRPLQLIHSDVMGPIAPASGEGEKYIITFIDDYTHFTACYVMKHESEAFKYRKIYETMATAYFERRISRFRCDNEREYVSKEIEEFFNKKGIQFEFTIPYTPEQNGVTERMNRTICEKARCMLLHSKLPKSFWSYAIQAAVYIINRCPTTALNGKLPATFWFGHEPNLKKLKVFGSVAYLHLPKETVAGKFNSKARKCYMIRYCTNGYKL